MAVGTGRGLILAAAALAVLATGGCSKLRESVGLTKNPPDEFRVVARQPLEMPPEFELRPPEPGAPRPQTGTTRDRARQTVFGRDQEQARELAYANGTDLSLGERALLTRAGADKAPNDIRELVARETERLHTGSNSLVNRLVFWQEPQDPATLVDASREAKRLRENTALGREVTAGRTPTIERREPGFLEGFFPSLL